LARAACTLVAGGNDLMVTVIASPRVNDALRRARL
jgi:hypothetical protein